MSERPVAQRPAPTGAPESLAVLLGGRNGAVDATLPPAAFVVGWLLSGQSDWSIEVGAIAALVVGGLLAGWRLARGGRLRAVILGLVGVCAAALVALYTGRAEDFFLIRLFTNVGSALAWVVSIAVRWPLLGVVVGTALGQRTRWRRDPALLRAYSVASWVWVGQYLVRVVVFSVLWWASATFALGIAQIVLTWPLIALCLAVSWWVLRQVLPDDHPGLRHPQG